MNITFTMRKLAYFFPSCVNQQTIFFLLKNVSVWADKHNSGTGIYIVYVEIQL